MGKFHIPVGYLVGLLCAAGLAFPAVASDPPIPRGNVSATVNPTTSYFESSSRTFRVPDGVRVSPITDVSPNVSSFSGGLKQSIPTGITIDAIKQTAPMSATVRASTQAVKSAAVRCFTSARCNLALMAGSAGINALFDGLDWVMGEGGQIQTAVEQLEYPASLPQGDTTNYVSSMTATRYQSRSNACAPRSEGNIVVICQRPANETDFINGVRIWYECPRQRNSYPLTGWTGPNQSTVGCRYGSTVSPPIENQRRAITDAEIQSGVESYNPDPSDWRFLVPELQLDDVEVISTPTFQGEPVTTTQYDGLGNPQIVTETTPSYEFDVRENSSARPALDLKKSEETKTYENGQLIGTSTTTSTAPAGDSSSGVDIPTDCDFMPTVCRFLEWFQQPDPDLNHEPDFTQLIDTIDIEREFQVGSSTAACPAPFQITLAWVPSVQVSLQPFCDLADLLRPFLLSLCFLYSGMIILRT